MVLVSLVGRKVLWTVSLARIHQVKFPYTMERYFHFHIFSSSGKFCSNNVFTCRGMWLYLVVASLNTLMSYTDPGHPARTNVNLMLKSQIASTFCVVRVLNLLITWHHTFVEEGTEPLVSQSRMNCSEFWVFWLYDICSKLYQTFQNFLKGAVNCA